MLAVVVVDPVVLAAFSSKSVFGKEREDRHS